MLAALDDLAAAVERLDEALDTSDPETMAAALGRLARLRTQIDAVWLRAVTRADHEQLHRRHGARDTASWVAGLAGDHAGVARRDVALAGALDGAPLVAGALSEGSVSKAKAAELVRAVGLPVDVQQDLVARAVALPVAKVAAAVERARLDHGIAAAAVTPELRLSRRSDHARIEATLDLVDTETLDVALTTAAETLALDADLPWSQRRAHALAAIARFYLDHQGSVSGRVGRPHVMVLVDLEVLEARTGGTALVGSGTVITGDDARRLAADANLTRVITHGRSEVLDVGRTTRTVPPAIAKAVIARDRHCKYAACSAPPDLCQVHHRQPWASGGPTARWNLGLLCWYHHAFVHRHGAQHLVETPDGQWIVRAPQVVAA